MRWWRGLYRRWRGLYRRWQGLYRWWRRRHGWEWFDTYDGGEWRRADRR